MCSILFRKHREALVERLALGFVPLCIVLGVALRSPIPSHVSKQALRLGVADSSIRSNETPRREQTQAGRLSVRLVGVAGGKMSHPFCSEWSQTNIAQKSAASLFQLVHGMSQAMLV